MWVAKTFRAYLFIMVFATTAYAFEAEYVHRPINENATKQSALAQYMRNSLGFEQGYDTEFEEVKTIELIKNGGETEDRTPRPVNHFHDPLQPWEDAGLLWFTSGRSTSALIWAQNYDPDEPSTNQEDWSHARWTFYQALTTGSEAKYAETFQTLGQLMHLVSDMAVPAHVRDDAHPSVMLPWILNSLDISHFEIYTKKQAKDNLLDYNGLPFKPSSAIFSRFITHDQAPVPVSVLWDLDQYTGSNPETTLEPLIGLAEYTNANFFSEDTIFREYPHPSYEDSNYSYIDWENPEITDAEDGETDFRIYIYKYPGTTDNYRLAALSYLSKDCIEMGHWFVPILDDVVFQDYAARLSPRAVGYSSALLDYFFRGKLEVLSLPVYTKNIYYGLLGLKIKNITETEESLTDGTFSLTLQYPNPDHDPSDPNSPSELYAQAFADSGLTETELPINELKFNEDKEIYFYLPYLGLTPEEIDSMSFTLAYRGGLGEEEDAVIGKNFKPEATEIFIEEWDSLEGNYPWQHLTYDEDNPDSGTTSNSYEATNDWGSDDLDTYLVKENIRFAGYKNKRANESVLDLSAENFEITPNTYIQFRIDDMSINEQPPSLPDTTSAWQFLSFTFSDGTAIQVTTDGQGVWVNNSTQYWVFNKGFIWRDNIYSLLYKDSSDPNPIFLQKISLTQTLNSLTEASTVDHEQYMRIDSIRLWEAVPK